MSALAGVVGDKISTALAVQRMKAGIVALLCCDKAACLVQHLHGTRAVTVTKTNSVAPLVLRHGRPPYPCRCDPPVRVGQTFATKSLPNILCCRLETRRAPVTLTMTVLKGDLVCMNHDSAQEAR